MSERQQDAAPVPVLPDGEPTIIRIERYPITTSDFNPVGDEIPLGRDPKDGRKMRFARGRVYIMADVSDNTSEPAHDFVTAEVNVIGWIGGAPDIFGRFAFGAGRFETMIYFDHPYDKITFEARQVAPVADVEPNSIGVLAVAKVWR